MKNNGMVIIPQYRESREQGTWNVAEEYANPKAPKSDASLGSVASSVICLVRRFYLDISVEVDLEEYFQIHETGGVMVTVAIPGETETWAPTAASVQSFWVPKSCPKVTLSHFKRWKHNKPNLGSSELEFKVPSPARKFKTSIRNLSARKGAVTVFVQRGKLGYLLDTHQPRTTDPPLVDRVGAEEKVTIIRREWFEPLAGEHGKPDIREFRNVSTGALRALQQNGQLLGHLENLASRFDDATYMSTPTANSTHEAVPVVGSGELYYDEYGQHRLLSPEPAYFTKDGLRRTPREVRSIPWNVYNYTTFNASDASDASDGSDVSDVSQERNRSDSTSRTKRKRNAEDAVKQSASKRSRTGGHASYDRDDEEILQPKREQNEGGDVHLQLERDINIMPAALSSETSSASPNSTPVVVAEGHTTQQSAQPSTRSLATSDRTTQAHANETPRSQTSIEAQGSSQVTNAQSQSTAHRRKQIQLRREQVKLELEDLALVKEELDLELLEQHRGAEA